VNAIDGPLAPAGVDPRALALLATDAAREAGELLLARYTAPPVGVSAKSGPTDLVSEADRKAERLLVSAITAARPLDGLLGEESAQRASCTGLTWVLDPLDGTTNFLWRIPHWAVSVAVEDGEGAVACAVRDAMRAEAFSAARGGGAELDGRPLSGPPPRPLEEITIVGDFAAPSSAEHPRAAHLAERLLARVGHVRALGSAALDLAWLAAGRVDAAYHERNFRHWDIAAGALLASEAGMDVRLLPPLAPGLSPRLLAAPPRLVEDLLALSEGRA
jgi:myo-inositol-1(or 4)-monophosphatase